MTEAELELLGRVTTILLPHVLMAELIGDLAKSGSKGGAEFVATQARKLRSAQAAPIRPISNLLADEAFGRTKPTSSVQLEIEPGRSLELIELEALASGDPPEGDHTIGRMLREDAKQSLDRWRGTYDRQGIVLAKSASVDNALEAAEGALKNPAVGPLAVAAFCLRDGSADSATFFYRRTTRRWDWWNELPLLYHAVLCELLTYICWRDGLISNNSNNALDVQYLWYMLPCPLFASGDKAHIRLAHVLAGPGNRVLRATDLRADLREIDDPVRERPEMSTATTSHFAQALPNNRLLQILNAAQAGGLEGVAALP